VASPLYLTSSGKDVVVTLNGTPTFDRSVAGKSIRSANGTAHGVWPAAACAEEFIYFTFHEPAPGVRVVRVAGELDLLTTPLLDRRLQSQLDRGPGHVVIDLSEVTFLAAAGLESLVTASDAAARHDVELHLTGTSHRAVARPLELVELPIMIDIQPTVHSVLAAICGRTS
jgi:anti-sigma B factor antagonist